MLKISESVLNYMAHFEVNSDDNTGWYIACLGAFSSKSGF